MGLELSVCVSVVSMILQSSIVCTEALDLVVLRTDVELARADEVLSSI